MYCIAPGILKSEVKKYSDMYVMAITRKARKISAKKLQDISNREWNLSVQDSIDLYDED
jgi:hypothetical protein